MDTALNLVPIHRSNAMLPISGQASGSLQTFVREDDAPGLMAVDRTGRKFTLTEQKKRLKDAARDFEAIFAKQLMKHMRSGLLGEGMFGPGAAGEIYSDMMDDAVAEKIADRGELGLADMLYRQMVKQLEPQTVPVSKNNGIKDSRIP